MVITIGEYYKSLKQKLESKGLEGLCLDIDDTLSATNLFWANHHIANFGNPEQLSAEDIIKNYRYVSNVPYWGNNAAAERWIVQNCEEPNGRSNTLPIEGSIEGVRQIGERVPIIAYLTGRTQPVVEGTRAWLEKQTFPDLDIIAQPSQEMFKEMGLLSAHEWKARVLEFLYPYVRGIVEDNAHVVTALSSDYQGTVFLFSHETADTDLDVICCPTWKDVVQQVECHGLDGIAAAYDQVAKDFLFTRTEGKGLSGFGHREIEQPNMFDTVPSDLTNLRLLELGCGPGIHSREYTKRGAKVTGVDISREMVYLAQQTCPSGDFEVGNVYHLRFEDNSFDMVTSSLLFDHLQDLDRVFEEVYRVLNKKGKFIFSVPHPMASIMDKDLKVSNNYFETAPHQFCVAGNLTEITAYQHPLMHYFQIPLKQGFTLQEFVENRPNPDWKKEYKNLDEGYLVVPQQCFFKWEKS